MEPSCGQLTPEVSETVETDSTTFGVGTPTPWYLASGIDFIIATLKLRRSSSLTVNLLYQTASVRQDKPNAWSAALLASDLTATDTAQCTGLKDISADTGAAMYVRFAPEYKATAGGTLGKGECPVPLISIG